MPWGVAAAAVGAAGSIYSADQSQPGPNYGGQLGYAAQQGYSKQTKDIRAGGKEAYQQYLAQMGMPSTATAMDISQTPGFQNQLQQGMNAVNQSAGSAGMLMSGDRLIGLQDVGMQTYGNYYQDYMSKLMGLTNMRQSAITNRANLMSGQAATQSAYQSNAYHDQSQMQSQADQNTMGYLGYGMGAAKDAGWFGGGGGGGGTTPDLNLSSIGLSGGSYGGGF